MDGAKTGDRVLIRLLRCKHKGRVQRGDSGSKCEVDVGEVRVSLLEFQLYRCWVENESESGVDEETRRKDRVVYRKVERLTSPVLEPHRN